MEDISSLITAAHNFNVVFNVIVAVGSLITLYLLIHYLFSLGSDETDKFSISNGALKKRSNMKILIDYGTGLQYLNSSNGGLTPRLDGDGNHMSIET